MQQPPNQPSEYNVLSTITRQLERLEERTRDIVTRTDLEALRKDVVARDLLEPQLSLLKTQIIRVNEDRVADRADREKRIEELTKRLDEMETEAISRSDRLWMRLSVAIAFFALLISLFEFLTHLRLTP